MYPSSIDKKSYCLASDLLVLATKVYKNGDTKNAARLFAQACAAPDLSVFINRSLYTLGSKGVTLPQVQTRVLRAIETAFSKSEIKEDGDGPISPEDLRKMLGALKAKASADPDTGFEVTTPDFDIDEEYEAQHLELSASGDVNEMDEDDDFSLDSEDEQESDEDIDPCPDCDSDPCICVLDSDGTSEEELSSSTTDLLENIKNSLVSLKIRSNDWEVKEFIPTLLQFFPDLAMGNPVSTRDVVNKIINRLHQIPSQELFKLDRMLIPLREG